MVSATHSRVEQIGGGCIHCDNELIAGENVLESLWIWFRGGASVMEGGRQIFKRESRCSRLRGMPEVQTRVAPSLAIAYPVRIWKAPLIFMHPPRMGFTNSQGVLYAPNKPLTCLSIITLAVKDMPTPANNLASSQLLGLPRVWVAL